MTADGRFAPSPTGTLHVGNLRTALLAWLFARRQGARFLVRMEDLDQGRVQAGAAERQLRDLRAIGLDWDGEVVAQSHRHHAYEDAVARLLAAGDLYECFCTRAEIRAAASAPHGIPASDRYPGTCRELTAAQRAQHEAAGRPPALRVRSRGARIAFEDRLLGRFEEEVDDFVVRRNDGTPAYQLAVVVDDAAQGIGEVVRGADLLDSTPRQILLSRLLGLPEPRYAHVPLVLGTDGRRLAKRHGAVTLADRDEGPEKIRAWMARTLGLARAGETPSPGDLIARFEPEQLPREPTIWSPETAV
jgi:glutamyl-tRNA synthetase